MTVSEYEREFVRLSKEFAVLANRAHKAEELSKEKKQANREAQLSGKRIMSKPQSSASKKLKKYYNRVTTSTGYFEKERGSQRSNPRSSSPSRTSVGSVGNPKPKCKHCNKVHFGKCRLRNGVCYGCGSLDHFLKDCPERVEKEIEQTPKLSNLVSRCKSPRHSRNVSGS
ncbi:uncharacterized protein [Gossypium hirsutum]|uniref:CCHC-type domain-containing protein n=1 Tax=Gossypium hirsutum TaxID=3635 RepID=A0ABM2ZDF3_GOSHI|nr:uncharacterized protein LOC121212318 [Gossypium hirsutum]